MKDQQQKQIGCEPKEWFSGATVWTNEFCERVQQNIESKCKRPENIEDGRIPLPGDIIQTCGGNLLQVVEAHQRGVRCINDDPRERDIIVEHGHYKTFLYNISDETKRSR